MSLDLDPQIAAALAPLLEHAVDMTPAPAGDVASRRATLNPMLAAFNNLEPSPDDVTSTDHHLTTDDDAEFLLRW